MGSKQGPYYLDEGFGRYYTSRNATIVLVILHLHRAICEFRVKEIVAAGSFLRVVRGRQCRPLIDKRRSLSREHHTLTYQNLLFCRVPVNSISINPLFCRVPINSISSLTLRTYKKKVGFGSFR